VNLRLVDGLTTAFRFHDARDLDDVTTFSSACLTSRCGKISGPQPCDIVRTGECQMIAKKFKRPPGAELPRLAGAHHIAVASVTRRLDEGCLW
jgi:hypothetical protein